MSAHPEWTHQLFSDEDLDAIAAAIAAAERTTSGEIRVHLEPRLPHSRGGEKPDALARARAVFTTLGMQRTADRNGVLIYLAIEDRQLAVLGDEGIHARVGAEYWEHVRDVMVDRFRAQAPRDGAVTAVTDVAEVLRRFFPRSPDD